MLSRALELDQVRGHDVFNGLLVNCDSMEISWVSCKEWTLASTMLEPYRPIYSPCTNRIRRAKMRPGMPVA